LSGVFSLNTVLRGALMFAALGMVPHAACAEWSVADAAPGMAGCGLETQEISLFDGYSDTHVRLSVANGALRVKTESNIDPGFNDLGIVVDGKTFMPADAVVDEKDVLFNSDIDAVIDQFIRGNSVTVYLRFWPTYPATQRYEARFSLAGFTRAYNDYKACSSKKPS